MVKGRKTYQRPKVTRVKLVSEEVVLGGCKNDLEAGASQAICTVPSSCSAYGT